MSESIEIIKKFREIFAQLDPSAEEALKLIKEGKHQEGYNKIIHIMNRCNYSHPKAWAYMSILVLRQAAANSEISALKPAEKGFKKSIDFQSYIFDNDDSLFELGKTIFKNINKYCDIYRLKVKKDTTDIVMQLIDDAKLIPDNGYNSTRQREQLNALQNKIDTAKEQGKLDASSAALSELVVYEHFLNKVKELEAYGEKSVEISNIITKNLENVESFDKEYLIDAVSASAKNIREIISENVTLSSKSFQLKQKKEREDAIKRYWEEHPDEKTDLERRLDEANNSLKETDEQLAECEKEYTRISKKLDKFVSSLDPERKELELDRDDLDNKINNLGHFKGKEKKSLENLIKEVDMKLANINNKIAAERNTYIESIDKELLPIEEKKKSLAKKENELKSEISRIKEELNKDRI